MPLRKIADIKFPTCHANFRLLAFERDRIGAQFAEAHTETALALILGDIHSVPPIVRIHSQCITGDVFHSLRCDCHDQLHLALNRIVEEGVGVLIYEQQEGRGIGLLEKLRAYELQEQGFDTVDANLHLGHEVDLRDYALPTEILRFLTVRSVRLLTNNPDKMNALHAADIAIVERISADVPQNSHSASYLSAKRERLGHLSGQEPFQLQHVADTVFAAAK
ncbi:GTP cyclohydrolase II [Acidicapsa dinghuensis]|uniref:GTP cyclohydrolase-2 n=1 Tax=Acidicapsa dinghuensis TaxID=2218256 RepID=A0ABW1EG85_9BACT|nr:GTP cyclohydrolase II [Acidicapsa dinghuensis]